jgi:hypothetical protein
MSIRLSIVWASFLQLVTHRTQGSTTDCHVSRLQIGVPFSTRPSLSGFIIFTSFVLASLFTSTDSDFFLAIDLELSVTSCFEINY